jgi:predicted transcriptional regulator
MTTMTITIARREDARTRMRRAFRGKEQGAFLSFASAELLWTVITPKRWNVVRAMTGAGPLAICEVARRVGRDAKSVRGDVQALLEAGMLDRSDKGGVEFPYDAVHVDFVLRGAA